MNLFFKSLVALFFICHVSSGQIALSNDGIGGIPLSGQAYIDVKGSPYLEDDFRKGDVIMASGRKFENMDIKYDILAKKVVFIDTKDGESKFFNAPVVSFSFKLGEFSRYFFRSVDGNFYELLTNGKVPLWKGTAKSIIEDRPYGTTKAQKIINTNTYYYTGDVASPKKMKADKKSIVELLKDKSAEVEGFIKKEGLNPKNEEELVKIFAYYNNL
ncbi:hypothetical protein GVN16_23230 [Emticicia sp. CRIBPO]|uniref:hypothetical protein n=1 Tax=Emticicia sp. CRIBPO TaxID=2683258 RepID=UPI001411C088|nr:hypothetical protein [Emticicia sp. CRIBPO]NBA88706.1 hypothetical protein [Emticicia sp. CRIBPO]